MSGTHRYPCAVRSRIQGRLGDDGTDRATRRADRRPAVDRVAHAGDQIGGADLTLAAIRAAVHSAVGLLRTHRDSALQLVDGRAILGLEHAHLLYGGLYPNAEGYHHMARTMTAALHAIGALSRAQC